MGEQKQAVTELIVVKVGEDYIRFKEKGFERVEMNKGSVYPLSEGAELQARCKRLLGAETHFQLMKLTIIEEPLPELSL